MKILNKEREKMTDRELMSKAKKASLNAYVPYSAVRSNEFFPADESALETWNALKADLLLRYPAAG